MDTQTKLFVNTSDQDVLDPILGLIPAGEQVSITTAGPVNVSHPALVDISDDTAEQVQATDITADNNQQDVTPPTGDQDV